MYVSYQIEEISLANLLRMLFLNFLCDHLVFFFVVDVMDCINWFLNIELFLHT